MNFIFLAKFKLYFSVHLKDHTLCLSTLKIIFLKCKTRWLFFKIQNDFFNIFTINDTFSNNERKKIFYFFQTYKMSFNSNKG